MLHYRIQVFSRTEFLAWNSFQSQVFHLRVEMKTKHFANIWKVALVSFAPL